MKKLITWGLAAVTATGLMLALLDRQGDKAGLRSGGPEAVAIVPALSDSAPAQPEISPTHVAGTSRLSSKVRLMVEPKRDLRVRYQALEALVAEDLGAEGISLVMDYVKSPISEDPLGADQARGLRNDILNVLRDRQANAVAIIPVLAAMARDEKQDPGLRDYAMQHMAEWMPQAALDQRDLVEGVLREALLEKDETYAGTALIGLQTLRANTLLQRDFDPEAEARRIVMDAGYSMLSRMTALAIANEQGSVDVGLVKLARQWSEDSSLLTGARRAAQAFVSRIDRNGRSEG